MKELYKLFLCLSLLLIAGCAPNANQNHEMEQTPVVYYTPEANPPTQTPSKQEDPIQGDPYLTSQLGIPYFLDNNHGWMVLSDHNEQLITTYTTEDGGVNWTERGIAPIKYGDGGIVIQFTDELTGFIETRTSGNCTLRGELLSTTDKGDHWTSLGDLPFGGDVVFTSSQLGWLTGGSRGGCSDDDDLTNIWFYKTIDGGKQWIPVELPKPSEVEYSQKISSLSPHFFNSEQGIMSVYFGEPNLSYIYRTNDSGDTWNSVGYVEGYDPQFSDLLHGSLIANGVVIWKTVDGGITWEEP